MTGGDGCQMGRFNATSASTVPGLGPDVRGHFGRGLCTLHLNKTTGNQAKRMETIGHSLSTKADTSRWPC